VSEKKTNRVSMFLGDADHDRFLSDCYDEGREPADFIRWLWLQHRKQKISAWADAIKRKEMELSGSVPGRVGERLQGDDFADTVQTR
jgi:hypothetical protein